jgi:hypothetical protein
LQNVGTCIKQSDLPKVDDYINSLTPIELPTDEEIEKLVGDGMHDYYKGGFTEGAKWVIEQIKKQK